MWWVLTQDLHGLKKGSYFADGYGGQRMVVIPHINSVIVHRINIKVPGTNVVFSELVPDAVIKRIMKAYTGKKEFRGNTVSAHQTPPAAQKPLLGKYGRPSKYYGRTLGRYKACFRGCAVVLASGIAIWIMLFGVRKIFPGFSLIRPETVKKNLFPAALKWITAAGSLLCSIYIFVILSIPYAFEYVSMMGMPADLNLLQKSLMHIPKLGVVLTVFLLAANLPVWTGRYWTLFERIHFTILTIAALIFTLLAYCLNLILLV